MSKNTTVWICYTPNGMAHLGIVRKTGKRVYIIFPEIISVPITSSSSFVGGGWFDKSDVRVAANQLEVSL